jgi:hypothetical protein
LNSIAPDPPATSYKLPALKPVRYNRGRAKTTQNME